MTNLKKTIKCIYLKKADILYMNKYSLYLYRKSKIKIRKMKSSKSILGYFGGIWHIVGYFCRDVAFDKIIVEKPLIDKLTVGKLSIDTFPFGKPLVGKFSFVKPLVDKFSRYTFSW